MRSWILAFPLSTVSVASDGASCPPVPGELRARKSRRAASRKRPKPSPSRPGDPWDGEGSTHFIVVELPLPVLVAQASSAPPLAPWHSQPVRRS